MASSESRPIRVSYVMDSLAPAGTELHVLKLIRALDRTRFRPYLCLLRPEDAPGAPPPPGDCPLLRLGVRSFGSPAALRAAWRFRHWLRRERIDIVQTHFPDSTHFAVPVARAAGVRCVLRTRRDLGVGRRRIDLFLGRLYNPLTTAVIANSEASRASVIAQERVRPEATAVIENGLELEPFAAIHEPRPDGSDRRGVVGMVANLRPVKAPDVFIRAAAILARAFPDLVFEIAGQGDLEGARRLAEECGLGERLRLPGSVRDVPAFLSKLDVAVLTSHAEGFSNALIEYMAAARPIVATAVGGNVEAIEDGVHGLLVPPGDPRAVAAAVERLVRDPAFAARLGAQARRRAAERYSLPAMAEKYQELYTRLLSAQGLPRR